MIVTTVMKTTSLITTEQRKKISLALKGQRRSIAIGRSYNTAGFGTNTPIVVKKGNAKPILEGQPYLKTNFSNGKGFSKTLYTPSTLRVVVGENWLNS